MQRPVKSQPATAAPIGPLNKHVFLLAIEPASRSMSVTARKIYNVILRLSQLKKPDAEGFYREPLSHVVQYAGISTKISGRVVEYIKLLRHTSVHLHLVADSDRELLRNRTPDLLGDVIDEVSIQVAGNASAPGDLVLGEGDQVRDFQLLGETRFERVNGRYELAWTLMPSVREMLVDPKRWAQIEFTSVAALGSYTAVALYEILARYKDAPSGLTSRHPPEWWTRILREGGTQREWRKFKSEMLVPALKEIAECTEIEAELIEHRHGKYIVNVQFRVGRRTNLSMAQEIDAVDVTLPLRAAAVGVRDDDLEEMVHQYGPMKVAEGLEALEGVLARPGASIARRGDYLKKILANRSLKHPEADGTALSPTEIQHEATVRRDLEQLRAVWLSQRMARLAAEFATLPPGEREEWILRAEAVLPKTSGVRRRIEARDWNSSLIRSAVLGAYAAEKYGPAWNQPSAGDLAALAT